MADECIQVVVRCRPFNRKEKEENRKNIIDIDIPLFQVTIRNSDEPGEEAKTFTYNRSYDENTQQRIFYEDCCFGLVESVLQGFNATIFAYGMVNYFQTHIPHHVTVFLGQTGCGKSFTMQGPDNSLDMRGVIPNSFNHIFQAITGSTDVQYLIRCSYLEIYNEEIRDLLVNDKNPAKCEIHEDPNKGIYVKNLSSVAVDNEEAMARVLESVSKHYELYIY
jgi:kinesin family protein 3/17